jgi:hypothetical protein
MRTSHRLSAMSIMTACSTHVNVVPCLLWKDVPLAASPTAGVHAACSKHSRRIHRRLATVTPRFLYLSALLLLCSFSCTLGQRHGPYTGASYQRARRLLQDTQLHRTSMQSERTRSRATLAADSSSWSWDAVDTETAGMPDSKFKKQEEVRDLYELPVIHAQHYVEKEYNMLDLRQAVKETERAVAKTVALVSGANSVSVAEDPERRNDNAAALAEYDSTSVAASKSGKQVKPAVQAVTEAINAARSGAITSGGIRVWHTPAAGAGAGAGAGAAAAAGAGASGIAAVPAGSTAHADAGSQAAPAELAMPQPEQEEDAPWHTAAASLAEDQQAQADLAKHEALLKELEQQQKQRQQQRQQQQEQQQQQQQAGQVQGAQQGGSSAAAAVQAGAAGGAAAAAAGVPAAAASSSSGSAAGGSAAKPHPVAFMTMYEKMLLVNPNTPALADYATTTALAGPITRKEQGMSD